MANHLDLREGKSEKVTPKKKGLSSLGMATIAILLVITAGAFTNSDDKDELGIHRTVGEVKVQTHQMGNTLYSDESLADLNQELDGREYFYVYLTYCRPLGYHEGCKNEYNKQKVYYGNEKTD